MQMLGKRSDEGKLEGLGWIDADIIKFDENLIKLESLLNEAIIPLLFNYLLFILL